MYDPTFQPNLQLQLIDTTSVFGKQINSNCHFDGSTLVYLAGAHILFVPLCPFSTMFSKTESSLWREYRIIKYSRLPFIIRGT
jgi:hypothetical protein